MINHPGSSSSRFDNLITDQDDIRDDLQLLKPLGGLYH